MEVAFAVHIAGARPTTTTTTIIRVNAEREREREYEYTPYRSRVGSRSCTSAQSIAHVFVALVTNSHGKQRIQHGDLEIIITTVVAKQSSTQATMMLYTSKHELENEKETT